LDNLTVTLGRVRSMNWGYAEEPFTKFETGRSLLNSGILGPMNLEEASTGGFFQRLWIGWKQFKNTRLYRRVPANLPVNLHLDDGTIRKEKIHNWSPGGLLIMTDDPLPEESSVLMEFRLGEDGTSYLKLHGQVIRHQPDKNSDQSVGMGIMFTDFSENGILLLRELLSQAFSNA